jgi:transposase
MFVDVVPNRGSRPAILLRESRREGKKVRKRTIANISNWPPEKIECLRAALKGGVVVNNLEASFRTVRSLPHGHVAAVLGVLSKLGLDRMVASRRSRTRDLVMAMIVARVISPGSKLALARGLGSEAHAHSLGHVLQVEDADEDELYEAMDWLVQRQESIEKKLVQRHLGHGSMVLYDVTSAHFEGRQCPLAKLGYPHGGPKGKPQIHIGVLADEEGRPVAAEVFPGNYGDPTTFTAQVKKVQERFGLERLIYVGDRGMITSARIREDLQTRHGIAWITALRSEQIKSLVKADAFQPSLFDDRDMAEITSPDFPGERLVVCRNHALATERQRKREELLVATEAKLDEIVEATRRDIRPLRGKEKIGVRLGRVLGRSKVAKHFLTTITDDEFSYERDQERIHQEALLDGFYVVRTPIAADDMAPERVVRCYKGLSSVEQAFRLMKSIDLKVRPIFHRLENRVRAHVFLCMLAYYVDWHMRRDLAPLLFEDDDPEAAEDLRESVVAKAQASPSAQTKASTKRTPDGFQVQSFGTLLDHLATIVISEHQPTIAGIEETSFFKMTDLDPLSQRAFDLLGVKPSV